MLYFYFIMKNSAMFNYFLILQSKRFSPQSQPHERHSVGSYLFMCMFSFQLEGAAVRAEVILRDMSKYGTTVGSNSLQNNSVILNEGDTIQLGMQSYTFR